MEHTNPRVEKIIQSIEDYANDAWTDAYNAGYDDGWKEGEMSAWDEARNKGYDEGFEDACQYILDTYVTKTGFVVTPTCNRHVNELIEQNSPITAPALLNYLHAKISAMKVDK